MLQNKISNIIQGFQEALTGYTGVITSDHAYIHRGLAFTANLSSGSISTAYYIAFTTPTVASGKYIHWRPLGLASSADYVEVTLYEDDSFSAGTDVTPINRNRPMSSLTSKMQAFKKGVTSTPTGTIIQVVGLGSTGNPTARAGGGAGADEEIVLKQNTSYVAKIDPAGATIVTGSLYWYEEDEGYTP